MTQKLPQKGDIKEQKTFGSFRHGSTKTKSRKNESDSPCRRQIITLSQDTFQHLFLLAAFATM